ncbi:MFS transporter [Actinomadura sp. ATCC 31491]|uniref:MFS transporter n=1 Tax=Actinomadura luzonensis TaxID=2805427 RepID=A0ABT0FYY4_9ACTN|nr:MFS transporter [Actinomadura luzonensis]MCK2217111.1 MFS transporter [Actinomadura luzonensis]
MSTPHEVRSRGSSTLPLATLFLGTFVLGSAELLPVGVINVIAADLRVSIAATGALVTAYAIGVAAGGPLLTALTIRMNRRTVLAAALLLCALGNLAPVLIADHTLFVVARGVTGALGGLFVAVAFIVGTSIVPPERVGRAISAVFGGFAVSGALGVPLGTLIGQELGWRGAFVAVVALTVVALIATLALIPSVAGAGGGARDQARHAFAPRVLALLALQALGFASLYAALTYIVPFLQHVTGVSGALISAFLLAYGAASAAGSIAGGRFAAGDAARTLTVGTVAVAISLLTLYLAGAIAFLVVLALLAWGLFAMGMVPSLQYRVVSLAGPGGALASSLPASAANVGIAAGSAAGGAAIAGFTPSAPVLTGLVIAVIAIPVAWATGFLQPPVTTGDGLSPDSMPSPS